MAKKKAVEPGVDAPEKPKINEAEVFAYQRRLKLLTKAEGEQLTALLDKCGAQYFKRGNANVTVLTLRPKQVVVDLTK